MNQNRAGLVLRVVAASLALLMLGCAAKRAAMVAPPSVATRPTDTRPVERLLTRRASITVRVRDVAAAAARTEAIVAQAEGIVAESLWTDANRVSFVLRVPSAQLETLLDQFAALGRESDRAVTTRDVTDQAFDLDARLQNKRALRERLRALLASASALPDVLAVEEQLARVQADIDMFEGQVERLRSEVALSHVSLSLERETRLGPLGYVFHGLWIGIRMLFVWH
jgi:hypothetical protein